MADELTDFASRFPVGATFEPFNSTSRRYVRDATTYLLLDKNANLRGVTDVHGGVFRCDGYQYVCWSSSPDDEPESWTDEGISRAYPPTLIDCGRRWGEDRAELISERFPVGRRVFSRSLAGLNHRSGGYGTATSVEVYERDNRTSQLRRMADTVFFGYQADGMLVPVLWDRDHSEWGAGSAFTHDLTPVYE